MASYLVIGGGLLGGAVAERLAQTGSEVVVFSRSFAETLGEADPPAGPIRTVSGAVAPTAELAELIDASDAILYFAGSSTPAGAEADPRGSVELSVVPATTVLELMRAGGTRRIVIASSGGTVYGEPSVHPTPEDHPADPIALHGHNALTIERYAEFFARRYGFEPVVLRIATAYGPGQHTKRGLGVISAWIEAALDGRPLQVYGDLATRRDFVFSADVAEAAVGAVEAASTGIYNIGSGSSEALGEVVSEIRRIAGAEVELEQFPGRGVDVAHTELDCSRIAAEIGWRASTSLAEGLKATWDWNRRLREGERGGGA